MYRKKSFWRGFGITILGIMLLNAAQIIMSFIIMIPALFFKFAESPEYIEMFSGPDVAIKLLRWDFYGEAVLCSMLVGELLLAIGIIVYFLCRHKNPLKELEINPISPWTAVLSVILGISLCVFVDFAIEMIPFPEFMLTQFDISFEGIYKAPAALIIAAIGIVGPICEEFTVRGMGMNALRRETNPTIAIVVSGLLFGLMHGIPIQVIYASFVGIILGLVFHNTKSLTTVIIIHMSNNIFSTYTDTIFTEWESPVLAIILSGIVSAVCIVIMSLLEKKRKYSVAFESDAEINEVISANH